WCHRNTLTTKSNYNTEGKEIVTGSNAIKIINKRSFSSSEDNRDINLQKVISERTRREFLKEQNRETSRESDESTITLLMGAPVVYESVDEPVGSSSRVPGVDMNRKRLLQKELTLKIGCYNINRLKTNQQKFETLDTSIDKRKGLGVALGIKHASEMDKMIKEITDIYGKRNKQIHIVILGDFNCVVDLELNKISKSKIVKQE
ncbi:30028_t:CDS:2, partial [Gigaspora margarita]